MTVATMISLMAIGLVAGLMGGILGIGGGLIVIPSLVFILGLSQHQAQGTNTAFMLLPIGIFAVMNYYKSGYVNVKYALVLAAMFAVGAYFGSKWAIHLPEKTLRMVFGSLIILVGIKMIWGK